MLMRLTSSQANKLKKTTNSEMKFVALATLYLVRMEICFVHESIVEIYLTVGRCLRAGH